jgi:hypothetical protein
MDEKPIGGENLSAFLASKIMSVFLMLSAVLAQAPKSWQEIYKDFILSAPVSRALLYDIDADGTPELVASAPRLAVYAIEGGKAVKKASLEEVPDYSFAAPADSGEAGLYVFAVDHDKHNCVISRMGPDFKLTEAGLIEWNADFSFSTGKALVEKYFLSGMAVSQSEFRERSPAGEPLSMPFVKSSNAEVASHAIEALLSSHPNQGGNPEFHYHWMQGQGMTYTGMYAQYPNWRFDTFPFPNMNPGSLPENWLLMIDGTLVPEPSLLVSEGERYIPMDVAEKRLPSLKGGLRAAKNDGKDYVAASSLASLGASVDVCGAYGELKILAIESKPVDRKYSKGYALDIVGKARESAIDDTQKLFQEHNGRLDETLEQSRNLEIKTESDAGRYYVFSIPEAAETVLFNSVTGAFYGESIYSVSSAGPGTGKIEKVNKSYYVAEADNIGGLAVMPNENPPQVRYADGTVERFSGEFVGLFINGGIVKNANVVIENGRCLVPLRLISESLGAAVEWDEKAREVTIKDGDHTIKLVVGSLSPTLDGREIKIDAAPKIIGDRAYVPLRFISESLGCDVAWSDGSDTWPRYALGMRHAMVSRYGSLSATEKEDALKDAKYQLTYGYGAKYEIYFQDLYELPASPTQEEKIRYMITNLQYLAENDRYYAFYAGEGCQVWIDKFRYTGTPLIWKDGDVQTFAMFYMYSKESMDIFSF